MAALVLLTLAACGPMSPEAAARYCTDRARAARGPTGEVFFGASNKGPVAGGGIYISSDFLTGRDPYVVYEQCVRERSGQGPIRPLDLKP